MPIEFDYFEYYNEFDKKIEEFKESIRKSVKEEIKQKLEKLEKENKELKEKNKNLDKLENEYKQKLKDFENEKNKIKIDIERKYYNASLNEFLDVLFERKKLYSVSYNTVKLSKCSYCNDDRKQTFIGADGNKYLVDCKCNRSFKEYYSYENNYQLYIQKEKKENNFRFIARTNNNSYCNIDLFGFGDNNYIVANKHLAMVYELNTQVLDEIKEKSIYNIYFTRKEDADEYAKYLNNCMEEK